MKPALTAIKRLKLDAACYTEIGDPAPTIVAFANKKRCNEIVMGNNGLGAVADLTFGRNGVATDTGTLLAIVATAWALDIAPDLIAAGIKTFEPELR